MNVPLAGYTTRRLLRASTRARVYEAVRNRDGRHVVAKVFELGDDGVEARVEHEFRLLQQLDVEGVVRALGVERVGEQLVLLLDYVVGSNLEQHVGGEPLSVEAFLPVAISLAATLGRVHARRVIHRDIKPSNVLVAAETNEIYLADFGISVLLESEREHLYEREVLEGTLPYVSPEQTGRTTREVDFRSDLYSLGATFYELLTGRQPFEATDPIELIHAHLARRPTPPHELSSSVPAQLSEIVMKLLEKAPEHRYQSASGLHADLERFAAAWAAGARDPRFRLAQHDHPITLQLPHHLHGRMLEQAALERELDLVAKTKQRRMVLLGGGPGLGKTALLRTLAAPVGARGGKIAGGKFEQHQTELPYRCVIKAFAGLLDQLLMGSDESLARWRRRLSRALGPIAAVVARMIPELTLVLGELPPVPVLEPAESRNRLLLALARFVVALSEDGPLVLALDDLHWADAASLELLRALVLDGGESAILFIGTWRSELVGDDHPLRELIGACEAQARPLLELELAPLSRGDVERMLSEALSRTRSEVASLAQIVERKTNNTPSFIRQFLVHIVDIGLLEPSAAGWQWDADDIAAAQIPDDIVGMMQAKLDGLGGDAQKLLSLAACVGSRFDPAIFEVVGGLGREAVAAALHELELTGLISPIGVEYGFGHDRIQAATRERIEAETRRSIHWEIGDYLLGRHAEDELGEQVFEVVDQLDAGLPVDQMSAARRQLLARLNLRAGQRALDDAAWRSARRYFDVAVDMLAEPIAAARAGQRDEQAFAAVFGQAQAMALAGDPEPADQAFADLLAWPLTITERARVLARRVRILELGERWAEAIDLALAGLAELDFALPRAPGKGKMILELIRAMQAVKGTTPEDLRTMAAATEERDIAVMHLLHAALGPAWITAQELWLVTVALHLRTIMRAGYHPTAPAALSSFAMALMTMGKADEARALVDSAIAIADHRICTPMARVSARSISLVMVGPQCRPFREVAEPMEAAYAEATEAGERYVAGLIGSVGLVNHLEAGTHLREILDIHGRLCAVDDSFGGPELRILADNVRRLMEVMLGVEGATLLSLAELEGEDMSPLTRYVIITTRIWGRFMMGEGAELWPEVEAVFHDFDRVLLGSMVVPRFAMIAAIVIARRWPASTSSERRSLRRAQRRCRRVVARFVELCPENFEAMAEVVAAEIDCTRGRGEAALRRFESARERALESGSHYLAAIASEGLAHWAAGRGLASTKQGGLRSAREAWERMGARAIVDRLDRELGRIALRELPALERSSNALGEFMRASLTGTGAGSGSGSTGVTLDVVTVLEILQVISEELELGQVINRVLRSAIENAGADRGLLLLDRKGGLALVAEGSERETREFMAKPVALRDARDSLPTAILLYVLRTGSALVVDDIAADSRFSSDAYVIRSGVRSLLCIPLTRRGARIGALVLENRLVAGAFTPSRLEILRILLAQAANALDNARLYGELSRSEAQWRSLVSAVPDVIALMDEHAQLEFVNHLMPYDADPSVLVGRSADAHLEPVSRVAWREAFSEVVATGRTREVEVCVAPEGQRAQWYMTRIVAVDAGAETKFLSIATDISQRKQLEAQLRQQQRLESLGTLASGVAHEINNPVQGILNYAELLHTRADDPATVRDFCEEITHESERVATIVRNLLAFSRQDQDQQREYMSMAELVESTLSLVLAVMRKDDVIVEIDIPSDLPRVCCRAQQIRQIVMNLVTNARDALNDRYGGFHEDKRIEITAAPFERDGADWVRLTIADHGGGIPDDVRARIFDPFFTTKGRDQGTGLGLSVSHGIAADHGGELRVDSEAGVGARFHLELPVECAES